MTRRRLWGELKTTEFAALDPQATVAILPVAAIEQHGPHLPVNTDSTIGQGMIDTVLARLPDDLRVLFLPLQTVGKSNEHLHAPGTLNVSAEHLLRTWFDIGESVHRAGLRKLLIINSHGGNSEVIGILAREFRVRFSMLAVATHWARFGLPAGVYTAAEAAYGIHAGDIETSLMLHFRPELVEMSQAKTFVSSAVETEKRYKHLRPIGPHSFGWIATDLHPSGAVGDASAATAEKGLVTAEHQADEFIALLRDMAAFPLEQLA